MSCNDGSAARAFCEEIGLAYSLRRGLYENYYDIREGERDFRHFYVDTTRFDIFTMIRPKTCAYDGVNKRYNGVNGTRRRARPVILITGPLCNEERTGKIRTREVEKV